MKGCYKMKLQLLLGAVFLNIYGASFAATNDIVNKSDPLCVPNQALTSNRYIATKWYMDSAEKKALYNEVFNVGLAHIETKVKQDNLKSGTWGVVFDIDETALDNQPYEINHVLLGCKAFTISDMTAYIETATALATPGIVRTTCQIKKDGGKVIMITNRDGAYDNKIIPATIKNLEKVGICFDSVLFSNYPKEHDKTPRFEAVKNGNYKDIIVTKKLPPINVLAYFGDNIQDFPNLKQTNLVKEDKDSTAFNKFGQEYFLLPNPMYGSWMANKFY